MPRNQLTKEELLVKILKLKHQLYVGSLGSNWSMDQKSAVHFALNQVLDIIEEYRY